MHGADHEQPGQAPQEARREAVAPPFGRVDLEREALTSAPCPKGVQIFNSWLSARWFVGLA
ncbi:hypothetical protein AB0I22_31180 [Streptomyces sp. NPDC050610]|uniref:hypothetical protein n=1 Tax=Streptomyces sp. NPDC050610 TaxID=3157097 RepID=UPI003417AD20